MKPRDLNAGQDSFLDIVANLVGILIILVVLVGAQAQSSWTQDAPNTDHEETLESLQQELVQTAKDAKSRQMENDEIERKIANQASIVDRLQKQRHSMMVEMMLVKDELKKRNSERSEAEQARLAIKAKLDAVKYELASTQKNIAAIPSRSPTEIEEIEHYPTPIAKTVFSDEVHFQLLAGRMTFVPMDALIERMKSEWKVKAEKLQRSDNTYETVGPIGDFRLQYKLASRQISVDTEMGPVQRRVTEFDHFVLRPLSSQTGELAKDAVAGGSEFLDRLDRLKPGRTTISIWVYPDSYDDLPMLKKRLREKGFQIATWPLQFGKLISGGPNGFRASAQ